MYDNYQFKELKWPSLKALTPKNYRRNNYLTSNKYNSKYRFIIPWDNSFQRKDVLCI